MPARRDHNDMHGRNRKSRPLDTAGMERKPDSDSSMYTNVKQIAMKMKVHACQQARALVVGGNFRDQRRHRHRTVTPIAGARCQQQPMVGPADE